MYFIVIDGDRHFLEPVPKCSFDPSAVTYTAQAIAAVVVALGALATVFRHKIAAFFKKNKGETAKREIHLKDEEQDADKTDVH